MDVIQPAKRDRRAGGLASARLKWAARGRPRYLVAPTISLRHAQAHARPHVCDLWRTAPARTHHATFLSWDHRQSKAARHREREPTNTHRALCPRRNRTYRTERETLELEPSCGAVFAPCFSHARGGLDALTKKCSDVSTANPQLFVIKCQYSD